ncbi:MAG: hypothetical protein U0984_09865 [Prosthecobacter sp.]|nr:hypothetical protein [Prosthecobacter sp.]
MNSRPTALLLIFLLLQAGQAIRLRAEVAVKAACPMACCQHQALETEAGCGCVQDIPGDAPVAPMPATPPAQGRDLLPQMVVNLIGWEANPRHLEVAARIAGAARADVRPMPATVALQVLHCAFLT